MSVRPAFDMAYCVVLLHIQASLTSTKNLNQPSNPPTYNGGKLMLLAVYICTVSVHNTDCVTHLCIAACTFDSMQHR